MKKFLLLIFAIILISIAGCFEDESASDDAGTGVIEVTVNTSEDIWGFPKLVDTAGHYQAFLGDTLYTYQYEEVGNEWDDPITEDQVGDLINIVYLYAELGDTSKDTPVLYKGVSGYNNSVIKITGIAAGEYYIVAFYDYHTGGNLENLLNRYDRYAIYADAADALIGNSTPYVDKKAKITIEDDNTTQVTLDIEKDWVIGKPKDADGGDGRIFLQSSEGIPTPGI